MAAIRLPRISNSTDVEALACEPGVLVRWVTDPADLVDADVVVRPRQQGDRVRPGVAARTRPRRRGHRARRNGQAGARHLRRLPDALPAHRRPGGIQAGVVDGLGLLDADIVFAPDKTLRHWDSPLHGYEIHHGQLERHTEDDWLGVGIRRGHVYGTHWHGLFDNDDLRRQWLTEIAKPGFVVADHVDVPARRDAQLDLMADLLGAHIDIDAVLALLENGPPQRPTVVAGTSG